MSLPFFFYTLHIGVYLFGQKLSSSAISHLFSDHLKGFDIEIIYSIGIRDFCP